MLVKDIRHILGQLEEEGAVSVPTDSGHEVFLRFVDGASKLSMSSLVYEGGNYIPKSVRNCLTKSPFAKSPILTFFSIDEEKYQVRLHYLGQSQFFSQHEFKEVLEDFENTAHRWRDYLDDHGKRDLIYVNVKN